MNRSILWLSGTSFCSNAVKSMTLLSATVHIWHTAFFAFWPLHRNPFTDLVLGAAGKRKFGWSTLTVKMLSSCVETSANGTSVVFELIISRYSSDRSFYFLGLSYHEKGNECKSLPQFHALLQFFPWRPWGDYQSLVLQPLWNVLLVARQKCKSTRVIAAMWCGSTCLALLHDAFLHYLVL